MKFKINKDGFISADGQTLTTFYFRNGTYSIYRWKYAFFPNMDLKHENYINKEGYITDNLIIKSV